MHINEVIKRAFELMRAEMLETVASLPEDDRPNLQADILYGVLSNRNVIRDIARKLEIETKMKPALYGVDTTSNTNW